MHRHTSYLEQQTNVGLRHSDLCVVCFFLFGGGIGEGAVEKLGNKIFFLIFVHTFKFSMLSIYFVEQNMFV